MNLVIFTQKLRRAADLLDDLFGREPKGTNENHHTARKILKAVKKGKGPKGFKYNGTHWTQTPAGKKRLARNARKMAKKRQMEAKEA